MVKLESRIPHPARTAPSTSPSGGLVRGDCWWRDKHLRVAITQMRLVRSRHRRNLNTRRHSRNPLVLKYGADRRQCRSFLQSGHERLLSLVVWFKGEYRSPFSPGGTPQRGTSPDAAIRYVSGPNAITERNMQYPGRRCDTCCMERGKNVKPFNGAAIGAICLCDTRRSLPAVRPSGALFRAVIG